MVIEQFGVGGPFREASLRRRDLNGLNKWATWVSVGRVSEVGLPGLLEEQQPGKCGEAEKAQDKMWGTVAGDQPCRALH